ncbi:prion-inhibition and propagation-domain-containing protein [Pyronema omphalodes]|nr:prion-inhibition and propagation-domain-containing protein [Pyronema omphalodes]
MEPAGLAFGIAGLFNSVLAIVDGLSSFQSCDKDVHGFSVMVSADYHRLLHWGKEVGLLQNDYLDGPYELHPRLNDQGTYVAVCNLLTLAIETFGEAKEVMQKHKSKTELSGSSRSFSFTSSSRQVKENLRGISRSWSFPSKRKALENAVEMGILADQYGNTTEKRTFPTKKATRATRMKWACFRKSQAQELEQKLQRFVDKLVALVPVQGNDAQHNFENSGTNKLVKDDGEKSIEGLDTDGFVTNFEGYTLAGVNSNGGGVSQKDPKIANAIFIASRRQKDDGACS